jgi:hypothetical protein
VQGKERLESIPRLVFSSMRGKFVQDHRIRPRSRPVIRFGST